MTASPATRATEPVPRELYVRHARKNGRGLMSMTALAYDGEDRVTATDANLEYTDETVAANVDDLGDKGGQLGLARTTAPLVAGILGVVLLGLGILLGRRRTEPETTTA